MVDVTPRATQLTRSLEWSFTCPRAAVTVSSSDSDNDHSILELPGLFADSEVYGHKFMLGPGSGGKIQIRFSGPDAETLRALATGAIDILYEDGDAKAIRTGWRQQVKVVRPVVAEEEANYAGVAMAVTVIFGLLVATVLTMSVVPVFYAMPFRVPTPSASTA